MVKDYETTSQATDYQSFVREQGFNRDLTVPKLKPKGVGSAMSRPHQVDDLDYAVNPKGAAAQEKYLQESERARLQQAADHGSRIAIAKLSSHRCKICSHFSPFESYDNLTLNSLVYGYVREYFSGLMPELNEDHARAGNSKLVQHIAYNHEPETKKACEVITRCMDARNRRNRSHIGNNGRNDNSCLHSNSGSR